MKKTMKLASLLAVIMLGLLATNCGKKETNTGADEQAREDSIKQAELEEELADPQSEAALEKEIRDWTSTRDHMLYYGDSLQHLLDSIDQISIDVEGKSYFKNDIWYARPANNYDENGKDSLLEITSYNDSVAEAVIQCTQFNSHKKNTISLKYNPLRKHWYIEDFRVGNGKSIVAQCKAGIAAMINKLKAFRAQQEAELEQQYMDQQPQQSATSTPRPATPHPAATTPTTTTTPATPATAPTPAATPATPAATPTPATTAK